MRIHRGSPQTRAVLVATTLNSSVFTANQFNGESVFFGIVLLVSFVSPRFRSGFAPCSKSPPFYTSDLLSLHSLGVYVIYTPQKMGVETISESHPLTTMNLCYTVLKIALTCTETLARFANVDPTRSTSHIDHVRNPNLALHKATIY